MMLIALGRCSHICNAGFITTAASRGKGVGLAMGEAYLEFAPKLVRSSPKHYESHFLTQMHRDTSILSSTWFSPITRPRSVSGRSWAST